MECYIGRGLSGDVTGFGIEIEIASVLFPNTCRDIEWEPMLQMLRPAVFSEREQARRLQQEAGKSKVKSTL
jgi:hypothetical protein